MTELLQPMIAVAEAQNKAVAGDYTASDGLLYCGNCRAPKQCRVELPGILPA